MGEIDTITSQVAAEVKIRLHGAEGGHDWTHVQRVWQNAKEICRSENANQLVVELAALLHDIADPKFHNGREDLGPDIARKILTYYDVNDDDVEHVVNIIRYVSFKNSIEGIRWTSPELRIVQDADRLDAIGAIGIARAFNYGGFKNRPIYNFEIPPNLKMSKKEYLNSNAPTINHFYEKLFLLKDKMSTETGKRLAELRHQYMADFIQQFYSEIGGTPPWHKL